MRQDNDPRVQPSKAEIVFLLATTAYRMTVGEADGATFQACIRKAFEGLVEELRKIEGVPAVDIDRFVADAQANVEVPRMLVPAELFAELLPDAVFQAALIDAGVFEAPEPLHPKFLEAGEALERIAEEEGRDAVNKVEHAHWFMQMVQYAPPSLRRDMNDKAQELGLMPKPTHVDANGSPVFTLEQAAAHHGLTHEEVLAMLPAMEGEGDLLYRGPTYALQ